MEEQKLSLTVPEAARLLSISSSSLWKAVNRDEVPNIKIGHRILIPLADLKDFLSGKPVQS